MTQRIGSELATDGVYRAAKDHTEEAIERLIFKNKPRIEALLRALMTQVNALETAFHQLLVDRLLDNAVGVQVDGIGSIVGESRKGRSDADYKRFIKVRILVLLSDGKVEQLYDILRGIFGEDFVGSIRQQDPASMVVQVGSSLETIDWLDVVTYLWLAKAGAVSITVAFGYGILADQMIGYAEDYGGEYDTPLATGCGSPHDFTYGGRMASARRRPPAVNGPCVSFDPAFGYAVNNATPDPEMTLWAHRNFSFLAGEDVAIYPNADLVRPKLTDDFSGGAGYLPTWFFESAGDLSTLAVIESREIASGVFSSGAKYIAFAAMFNAPHLDLFLGDPFDAAETDVFGIVGSDPGGGDIQIVGAGYRSDGGETTNPIVFGLGSWHVIELWETETAPGASTLSLRVDGGTAETAALTGDPGTLLRKIHIAANSALIGDVIFAGRNGQLTTDQMTMVRERLQRKYDV